MFRQQHFNTHELKYIFLQNWPWGECTTCSISCENIHHSAWNAHFPNVYVQPYHSVWILILGFLAFCAQIHQD